MRGDRPDPDRIYLLRMRRMDTGENPNRSGFYKAGLVHA